ncbi:MAG TPA: helix-turn-helix domain-containing protein [Gammaproteobacteria bacterium]|nr:helix-turn-helix domain-containing protein [Gammaproteobacteria bacterium]
MNDQGAGLARVGALLADASRSAMLLRLMDGRAYTAGELARAAGIAASTATHHLERLEAAGLLAAHRQGRNRYVRIANEEVASFLEQALAMHAGLSVRPIATSCPRHLREARLCYNHLAGAVGVHMLAAGLAAGIFVENAGALRCGENAAPLLRELGIEKPSSQGRYCLDWSERRFHLAGPLASELLHAMLEQRWLLRGEHRQLLLTEKGRRAMRRWFAGAVTAP